MVNVCKSFVSVIIAGFAFQVFADTAPKAWSSPVVDKIIYSNVLYLPISDSAVKAIPINDSGEELIDLLKVDNPRIQPMSAFNTKYRNTYDGYSKVRLGVYKKLLTMLKILPQNVGITYFEGFRTLQKQKEYFDKKFREILITGKDREMAYQEAAKFVSPFIDNIPPHATGAAIDISLFSVNNKKLIDMGKSPKEIKQYRDWDVRSDR